jgi:ABC-type sugar transport system substrate-binding protein
VGLDATEEGREMVRSGDFYATVDLQPTELVIDGLDALSQLYAGATEATNAPGGIISIETKVLKADDLVE